MKKLFSSLITASTLPALLFFSRALVIIVTAITLTSCVDSTNSRNAKNEAIQGFTQGLNEVTAIIIGKELSVVGLNLVLQNILYSITQSAANSSNQSGSIEECLLLIFKELEKLLPLKVTPDTLLTNVNVENRNISFIFILVNIIDGNPQSFQLNQSYKGNVINTLCNDLGTRYLFTNNVSFQYHYHANNGDLIQAITVSLSDCGSN